MKVALTESDTLPRLEKFWTVTVDGFWNGTRKFYEPVLDLWSWVSRLLTSSTRQENLQRSVTEQLLGMQVHLRESRHLLAELSLKIAATETETAKREAALLPLLDAIARDQNARDQVAALLTKFEALESTIKDCSRTYSPEEVADVLLRKLNEQPHLGPSSLFRAHEPLSGTEKTLLDLVSFAHYQQSNPFDAVLRSWGAEGQLRSLMQAKHYQQLTGLHSSTHEPSSPEVTWWIRPMSQQDQWDSMLALLKREAEKLK